MIPVLGSLDLAGASMLEPAASRFWHVALQSGLISAEDLQACWDALPVEKRTIDAIDRRVARVAVSHEKLTLWQAQQLLAGKSSGYKIAKYVLLDRIGQGGMGRVYLAADTRLNRKVALKVLAPERMNNPRAIARFRREAKVGAQLQHENLVRIYDDGDAGGLLYLVMEFIDGKNLAKIISEGGPMLPCIAARLARQVALGLEHANQKGLIHRDVNPSNILVTIDGIAKLTDLGLAIDLADSADVTRDGATVGTFDYVSPEQARNSRGVDTRSDIYSLGCTLYHMLTAQVPFPCSSLPEKLYAHQLQDPPRLATVVPGIPASLDAIVLRMMKKKPEDRFQTPQAVAEALAPFDDEEITPHPRSLAAHGANGLRPLSNLTPMAPETRSARQATSPTTPAPDTAHGSRADPFVSLPPLDLGLDSSLINGLVPKNKSKTKSVEFAKIAPVKTRKLLISVGIGTVTLILMVVGVTLWMRQPGNAAGRLPQPPESKTLVRDTQKPGALAKASTEAGNPSGGPVAVDSGIAVVTQGEPTRELATFRDAVQFALARGGEVVLSNTSPIKVAVADRASIEISGKPLTIRAGEGTSPVIEVELKAQSPWLLSRPGAPLTLRGLTILAKFSDSTRPPALIWAGDRLTVESCSLQTRSVGEECRAIRAEGSQTTIERCFFAGFGRAIEFLASVGKSLNVTETMIVNITPFDVSSGWAIRAEVKGMAGSTKGQKPKDPLITIKRSTIYAEGAIEIQAKGLTSWHPPTVELIETAVKAKALLAWPTPKADLTFKDRIRWVGQGNRYEIIGKGALVVLAGLGGSVAPDPTLSTLEAWNKEVADNNERKSEFAPLEFATPVANLPDQPTPANFALPEELAKLVGADASKVGNAPMTLRK